VKIQGYRLFKVVGLSSLHPGKRAPQRFQEWEIDDFRAMARAASLEEGYPFAIDTSQGLVQEAAFAKTSFSAHGEKLSLPGQRSLQATLEYLPFPLSSHERSEPALRGQFKARVQQRLAPDSPGRAFSTGRGRRARRSSAMYPATRRCVAWQINSSSGAASELSAAARALTVPDKWSGPSSGSPGLTSAKPVAMPL
jgi:hypothetical protein